MDKRFITKKVNLNGQVTDFIIPVSALDKWKHLIVK